MQQKLVKQYLHAKIKKIFEPITGTIKTTSENITKTITATSVKNNQAIENLNTELIETMNDRGVKASPLLFRYLKPLIPKILVNIN